MQDPLLRHMVGWLSRPEISIMPSTGTPEPGGLGWYQIIGLLKQVAKERHVVGFDVVELMPNKYNKAPDFIAAKLVYKFLSYIFTNR